MGRAWSGRSRSKSTSCARASRNTGSPRSATSIRPMLTQVLARLTDFGEHAARRDGSRRHRARGALDRRSRRAGRARCRHRGPQARAQANDFLAREIAEAAGPLFRLRPSADAGLRGRRRRARALHARAEVLRRHDQRPHQRPISRPPVAAIRSGSARRRSDALDLHPSGRPGDALARARRPQRAAARDLGMGLRDRLARAASRVRRRVRPLSARAHRARPSRRNAAVSAVALRQPRQALWRQARQAAVAVHQARTSW